MRLVLASVPSIQIYQLFVIKNELVSNVRCRRSPDQHIVRSSESGEARYKITLYNRSLRASLPTLPLITAKLFEAFRDTAAASSSRCCNGNHMCSIVMSAAVRDKFTPLLNRHQHHCSMTPRVLRSKKTARGRASERDDGETAGEREGSGESGIRSMSWQFVLIWDRIWWVRHQERQCEKNRSSQPPNHSSTGSELNPAKY